MYSLAHPFGDITKSEVLPGPIASGISLNERAWYQDVQKGIQLCHAGIQSRHVFRTMRGVRLFYNNVLYFKLISFVSFTQIVANKDC